MNGDSVGELQFVEFAGLIVDEVMMIERHGDGDGFGRDLGNVADVAVEDILFVIVADLDDFVSFAESLAKAFDFEFQLRRRIECFLQ